MVQQLFRILQVDVRCERLQQLLLGRLGAPSDGRSCYVLRFISVSSHALEVRSRLLAAGCLHWTRRMLPRTREASSQLPLSHVLSPQKQSIHGTSIPAASLPLHLHQAWVFPVSYGLIDPELITDAGDRLGRVRGAGDGDSGVRRAAQRDHQPLRQPPGRHLRHLQRRQRRAGRPAQQLALPRPQVRRTALEPRCCPAGHWLTPTSHRHRRVIFGGLRAGIQLSSRS